MIIYDNFVKETKSKHNLSDFIGIETHNYLVRKRANTETFSQTSLFKSRSSLKLWQLLSVDSL